MQIGDVLEILLSQGEVVAVMFEGDNRRRRPQACRHAGGEATVTTGVQNGMRRVGEVIP